MKDYDINKELSYIQYWDVNNICLGNTFQFNEDFI